MLRFRVLLAFPILLMLFGAVPSAHAAVPGDECGVPAISPATDNLLFLWKDCAAETWHVRATSGGSAQKVTYQGMVISDQPFSPPPVVPFSLESNDVLDTSDPLRIDYQLNMRLKGKDGFDFTFPATAQVCFDVTILPAGSQVVLGGNRVPVSTPIDLGTLGTCGAPPPGEECGQPSFNPGVDQALYLWKTCGNGKWHVRATSGGSPAKFTYTGSVASDEDFTSVTPFSFETNDVLDIVDPARINYTLNMKNNGVDGFDFAFPSGANVCFELNSPSTGPVRLGANATSITTPVDLETLEPCQIVNGQMNFVVFLTDDQRWDSLFAMPILGSKLTPRGVLFDNAFVTTPLCCPARANIHSGGFFAYNTGVLSGSGNVGGERKFRGQDVDTIATTLQGIGYKTMFAGGKYLNAYGSPYVPPGWTKFVNNVKGPAGADWFSFNVVTGSSGATSSTGSVSLVNQYVTNYHRDQVLDFLDTTGSSPFLVFFSVYAPHAPATPDTPDQNLFSEFLYRDRAFGEADLSDKPEWVSNPNRAQNVKSESDEFHRKQLRSLQSVDRAIGAIVDKIELQGKLDNTVFIFTSDNGYLWGEHGLYKKGQAYEESVRVPFIIVVPGITPRTDAHMVAADLDIGPSIFELAEVSKPSDGMSLVPLLQNPNAPWRTELMFQHWGNTEAAFGTWSALRTEEFKYIENSKGEVELYDLVSDPFEEESQHSNPAFGVTLSDMASRLAAQRGLGITRWKAPNGQVGQNYSFELTAWGGTPPYQWSIPEGSLPPGLSLNASTGRISGVPTQAGSFNVKLKVTDNSIARHTGQAQRDIRPTPSPEFYTITIAP